MTIYKLSDKQLEKVKDKLTNNGFEAEGCMCGTFECMIENKLHIRIYRSCYKSSINSSNGAWELDKNFTFYIKDDENDELDVEFILDIEQEKILLELAKIRSIQDTGYDEYWNKKPTEEDCKEQKHINCPICGCKDFDYEDVFGQYPYDKDGKIETTICPNCKSDIHVKVHLVFEFSTFTK